MTRMSCGFDWSAGDDAVESAMVDLEMSVTQAGFDFAAGDVWQEEDDLIWESKDA